VGDVGGREASSSGRRRVPWAQLLRRLLHVGALSYPRRSTTANKAVYWVEKSQAQTSLAL